MRGPDFTTPRTERRFSPLALLGATAAGGALLILALYLGSWAFGVRSSSLHERRLAKVLERKPKVEEVSQALRDEGLTLVASATTPQELAEAARLFGGPKAAEVLEKGREAAHAVAVFSGNGVVYFLFFDSTDTLSAYTYLVQ